MNKEIGKLRAKIEEIEGLKAEPAWGAKFQLWLDLTKKLVKKIFGDEGFKLFNKQGSVVLTDEAYIQELDSRKEMLNGLLSNKDEYKPKEKLGPIAIKVNGKLKDVIIEDNASIGARLLEADEVEGDSVARNRALLSPILNIENSQLHFGRGDNVGSDKNQNPQSSLIEKYWWGFFIPIFVGVIVFFINNGEIPRLLNMSITPSQFMANNSATSTMNIWNILSRSDSFNTSLEKQGFLERDLLILKKGDGISFAGIFANSSLNGVAWYIKDCSLFKTP